MSSTARIITNIHYAKHLFNENVDGYVQVIQIKDKKIVHLKNYKGIEIVSNIENYDDAIDVFMSINPSFNGKRQSNTIRQLRALYIDLDNTKLSFNEIIQEVWNLAFEGKVPEPSMVVSSGRGIHLYWRIQDAPFQALSTWQELEDYLYYQLKYLGADKKATDPARVLRMPGTINSRSNTKCEVAFISDEIPFSMYELREKYLGYKPKLFKEIEIEQKINNKTIKSKVINYFTSYSLHITRAEDILTLCQMRKFKVTGYRNKILHMYAYWIGVTHRDEEELSKLVNELNNKFTEPLKQTEVNAILRCVPKAIDKFIDYEQGLRVGKVKRVSKGMRDKGGYWYKNETIIEMLDITIEEQRQLKTIIGTQVKYERNNVRRTPRNEAGLTAKQQELADLKVKILELRERGLKNKDIASHLNKPIKTIERHITAMKKRGEL